MWIFFWLMYYVVVLSLFLFMTRILTFYHLPVDHEDIALIYDESQGRDDNTQSNNDYSLE